jgi:hypothetical protein
MMKNADLHARLALARSSWSNRILLLSLAGIFFLTLYPFRFEHQVYSRFLFPFSLKGWGSGIEVLDVFLNILLFIPYGFGLAEKLREHGKSKAAALITVYISGALLSYLVEFLQIYVPHRDSGWTDVITNSAGALIGAWIFALAGTGIIAWFSAIERRLESWLSLPKIGAIVAFYVGFWCVLAGPLQKQTKLTSWTPDSFLAIGDSASLQPAPPWKGRVLELDIWSRALPAESARRLSSKKPADGDPPVALVDYEFSGSAPFHDNRHFLPDLDWASQSPLRSDGNGAAFDGHSWLISTGAVPMLVRAVENTGKFALRLVCQPGQTTNAEAKIVSISSPTGTVDMELGQSGSALAFWFRNPLSLRRSRMTWMVPRVFTTSQMSDLLLSFNGSAVSLYVNGREYGEPYELGPGAALVRYVRHIKTVELEGYEVILYAIIFFPPGCLLGFAWRRPDVRWIVRLSFLFVSLFFPPAVLEWVIASAAGRPISVRDIGFSALIALSASLWMNADGSFSGALRREQETVAVR